MGLVERFLELKRQALAAAEAPLPDGAAGWTELAPGARTAASQATAPSTWVRLTAEADFQWRRPACAEGLLLTEGSLELDGERYAAPCYLFLAVGASPRCKTRTGAVAVCVPLRG